MLSRTVGTPLVPRPVPSLGAPPALRPPQHGAGASFAKGDKGEGARLGLDGGSGPGAWTISAAAAAAVVGCVKGRAVPARTWGLRAPRGKATAVVALAAEDAAAAKGKLPEDDAAPAEKGTKKALDGGAVPSAPVEVSSKGSEDAAAAAPEAAEDLPVLSMTAPTPDPGRVALVAQRLVTAEQSLRRWGYVAEVVYTWLGLISLGIASFAAFSHGTMRAYRSPAMALGPLSVGASLLCSFVGWFQARGCRSVGRRCGIAASSLEPGGPPPPAAQFITVMPALADIESGLRARQRTAWLGALFAVVGMQAMVGLLVGKVLAASGGVSSPPGVSLDVFTLLSVSNCALSHIIGGGAAAWQHGALPPPGAPADDPFRGWGRR